jgi:hypothetical protein
MSIIKRNIISRVYFWCLKMENLVGNLGTKIGFFGNKIWELKILFYSHIIKYRTEIYYNL